MGENNLSTIIPNSNIAKAMNDNIVNKIRGEVHSLYTYRTHG